MFYINRAMARPPFSPGDKVFARYQGRSEFELVGRAVCDSAFPHWTCKTFGGRRDEYWIIPEIHLSRKEISFLIGEHNRKQLTLKAQ
jgi:hypothetical protein